MATLNAAARRLIESGPLAHLVTIDQDGSPQVSVVWMGLDGAELVSGHLDGRQRKLANIRRDPRVAVSFETSVRGEGGLTPYLVVHGTARITEGGDLRRPGNRLPADARPATRLGDAHPCRARRRPRTLVTTANRALTTAGSRPPTVTGGRGA
jgi:PPOX class probable F420-dependent enzyme